MQKKVKGAKTKVKGASGKLSFLNTVAEELKPDYSVYTHVDSMLNNINSSIKKLKIKAVAVTGGSIAKGNYITYDHDIDLFVKFDKSYNTEKLSDYLEKILKGIKGIKAERIHGSRDYFRIKSNYNFEIVPVFSIKKGSESKNVTDMSPLHVDWVKGIISKKKNMNDEIRLTKQFCKAQNVYGAESYIRGFSGHVIDIITIYHGSFIDLVKSASKWKAGEVIDYHNAHKGKALFNLNKSKIGPLNVIDPIMPERNASAALSEEKFNGFIESCKNFLKKPSKDFFKKKEVSFETLKAENKGKKVLCFSLKPKAGKEDIVGAKIVKALEYILMKAEKEGFKFVQSGWIWDRKMDAMYYFVMDKDTLPKEVIVNGPSIEAKEHVIRFKAKHKGTFVKSGKMFAKEIRKNPAFTPFLLALSKENFFDDKFEQISLMK